MGEATQKHGHGTQTIIWTGQLHILSFHPLMSINNRLVGAYLIKQGLIQPQQWFFSYLQPLCFPYDLT